MLSDTENDDHYHPSLKLIEIEKTNSIQCGFQLTRTKFDPYPWVSSVDQDSAASTAGLKPGDCILEVNGDDIVGKRISEIAEIVKSKSEQVSFLLWNAGVDTQCTPENLCCGPLPNNLQRLISCLSTILAFLECPVCLDTIPRPSYQCDNGHLICIRCRSKTERCPVCRIRLHRGRSLMADHVFTTIADTFTPAEESEESRLAKIHKIFKQKNKKKNVPDIKITKAYSNKLLTKVVGKSSSADNLSSSKYLSPNNVSADNIQLKTKSLSANEIFVSESPTLSRNGSCSRLTRNSLNPENSEKRNDRPSSYHGSFESLDGKNVISIDNCFNATAGIFDGSYPDYSYYCPFSNNCLILLKGGSILEHFLKKHSRTGPLIHYFIPNLEIYIRDLRDNQDYCYIISSFGRTFFLKILLRNGDFNNPSDILLWVWCLGCKNISKNYGVQLKIKSLTREILLSVRTSVFSLSSTSPQEIEDCKKGVYLNSRSLSAFGLPSNELLLETTIFEHEV